MLPDRGSKPDVEQAVQYAEWWLNMALDRFGGDDRHYAPQLRVRLSMARAQLVPAVELAKHEHDQITLEDVA